MGLSIRLRLTLVFALTTGVILGGAGAFLYFRLGSSLQQDADAGLRSRAAGIVASRGRGSLDVPSGLLEPDEAFAQILNPDGTILDSSHLVSDAPLLSGETLRSVTHPTFFTETVPGLDEPARVLAVPTSEVGRPEFVVVGTTSGDRQETLADLATLAAIVVPLVFLLISSAGWVLAGAILRPVERMRQEAEAVSASRPNERLAVPRTNDELARLAATLNSMLSRLREAAGRERRFVDQASHELRTPLGVMKTELELARSRTRSKGELEAVLDRALEDTNHLARLAEDLLVLSRANEGRLPIHRIDVSLRSVLEEACAAHRGEAELAGVRVELEAPADTVRIDPVRLRQVLNNLLDNSLHQVSRGGHIRITGEREDGTVRIAVEDTGPGFPEDLLDHVFEPFTRGDAGADNHETGAGLGLAIVRAVVSAHGGVASAENRPQGGARVTLVLRR
jgi:two-component system, OmpR family, sensor kinase